MALSKTVVKVVFGQSVNIPNTYSKIESISGDKNSITMNVITRQEKDGEEIESKLYTFTPSMEGLNFIGQGYAHLKSLPDFDSAIDC